MKMHHSHNEDRGASQLVDHTVRKSSCSAAAGSRRERGPGFGKVGDPLNTPFDFFFEVEAETRFLLVVIRNRRVIFCAGRLEELDAHQLCFLPNTSLAGTALIFPLS